MIEGRTLQSGKAHTRGVKAAVVSVTKTGMCTSAHIGTETCIASNKHAKGTAQVNETDIGKGSISLL